MHTNRSASAKQPCRATQQDADGDDGDEEPPSSAKHVARPGRLAYTLALVSTDICVYRLSS